MSISEKTARANVRAKAQVKLEKARNWLIYTNRFWATLILQTKVVWDETKPIACTNGERIYLNPVAIADLTVEEVIAILAHEMGHILGGDIWIPAEKGLTKIALTPDGPVSLWNIAADYWINNGLTAERFSLLSGALIDSKYDGWTKIQIYRDLEKQGSDSGGGGDGEGGGGPLVPRDGGLNGNDLLPSKDAAPNKAEVVARNGILLKQAAASAKAAGQHIPSWAQETIQELDSPTIPWKDLLLHRLQTILDRSNWTYKRTNRRLWPQDAIAPTLRGTRAVGEIGLFLDTSGSMSSKEMTAGVSEFQGILDHVKPSKVHLIQVDSAVRDYKVYEPGENLLGDSGFEVYGRGGTSFCPPFEYVDEKEIALDLAVYFTDLEGGFPSEPPPYPVIWVSTTDINVPFGDVIRMSTIQEEE